MSVRYRSEVIHLKGSGTGGTVAVLAAFTPSVAQQFVNVIRLIFTVSAAGVVTLQDTGGNALSQPFQLGANSGITLDVSNNMDPWFMTTIAGNGLQFAQATGANTIAWDLYYMPTI